MPYPYGGNRRYPNAVVITPEDNQLCIELDMAAAAFERRLLANPGDSFAVGKAETCRNIAQRVRASHSFASARQRAFAEALVRWSRPMTPASTRRAEQQSARADANSAARREVILNNLVVQRIVTLMNAARTAGLSYPKIRLAYGEWKIKIYPAPAHGRHPSDYYVRAASSRPDLNTAQPLADGVYRARSTNLYCGRIESSTGQFFASEECPLDVMTALREFAADPSRVATAYGHAHGACCFCGRALTDGRSVAMGYGPVCAEAYGLEWGEQRARSSVTINVDSSIQGSGGSGGGARIVGPSMEEVLERRIAAARSRGVGYSVASRRYPPDRTVPTESIRPTPAPLATPVDPDDEDSHFM